MIFLLRTLLVLAVCAAAWAGDSIAVLERSALAIGRSAATPSHRLDLVLAYFEGDWRPEAIRAAVRRSAQVLAQCGVEIAKAELVRLDAPARFRVFDTPRSRFPGRRSTLSRIRASNLHSRPRPSAAATAARGRSSGTRCG